MRKASQRLIAATIAIMSIFIGLEVMAKFSVSFATPTASEPMFFDDAVMGARPNPKFPEHDADGWRNAAVQPNPDIIALGDSQTYGMETDREHAWPQQLGSMLGRSVYQIAFGGYNPTSFLRLAPKIFSHKPKVVVLGIYFGANFQQAYDDVYKRPEDPELIRLRSNDTALLARLNAADEIDGKRWVRAQFLDCQRPIIPPDRALLRI